MGKVFLLSYKQNISTAIIYCLLLPVLHSARLYKCQGSFCSGEEQQFSSVVWHEKTLER